MDFSDSVKSGSSNKISLESDLIGEFYILLSLSKDFSESE